MSTTTSPTRSRRPVQTMAADLHGVTVAEALDAAEVLWPTLHPTDAEAALAVARTILTWATKNDTVTLTDLTDTTAGRMLTALTGEKNLTAFAKPKTADRIHLVRNTLTALRGTALATRTDHTSKRSHRPAKDSLDAGLPAVTPRTQLARRPLRDDEILLARLLVEIDLREGADPHTLHSYLFAEIGLRTSESVCLTTKGLDDRTAPTQVVAVGAWKLGEHAVKIPTYPQRALARTLPLLREGTQPLTYTGSNQGKGASASVDPKITRFLARAGVTGPDLTARSVSLWRADHALRAHSSLKKANRIHGGRVSNLLHDLRYRTDDSQLHHGVLLIRDHTGKTVAKVPAKHRRLLDER
jgi:hypothetical protein